MLDRLKQAFSGDQDDDRRDEPRVQHADRRGTGDETPEHPPTAVARPEEVGHTPEPAAGVGGRESEMPRVTGTRHDEAATEEYRARASDRGTVEGARMREEGQGDLAPQDQRWIAGDKASQDSSYRPDPPNHNPARDEGRSLTEEAQILANDIVGQKPTAEGTAGHDGTEPPRTSGA